MSWEGLLVFFLEHLHFCIFHMQLVSSEGRLAGLLGKTSDSHGKEGPLLLPSPDGLCRVIALS